MKLHPKAPPQVRRNDRWGPKDWVDLKDIAKDFLNNPPRSVVAEGSCVRIEQAGHYGTVESNYLAGDEEEAREFAALVGDPFVLTMWLEGAYNPRE